MKPLNIIYCIYYLHIYDRLLKILGYAADECTRLNE